MSSSFSYITLLIIAHPDDETLFFSPLLSHFLSSKEKEKDSGELHILCLSTGNALGMGAVRTRELLAAASFFGLRSGQVTVVDHPCMQDGMNTEWPAEVVADA
eukprot:gene51141-62538_t